MKLLAKIVKASFARVVKSDAKPKPHKSEKANKEPAVVPDMPDLPVKDTDSEVAALPVTAADPDFENLLVAAPPPPSKEAYQAAYDELVIAAQDEVAALLNDARNEALAILRDAEAKARELRDQAWDDGYSSAYSQTKEEVGEIIAKANSDAEGVEARLVSEREQYLQKLERQMLGVALDVAGKILSKELDTDNQAYLSMLREAVSRMPSEDFVSIRLHPEEYERFFKTKETKLKTLKGQVTAKLIPDPSLDRYDALIESPSGVIDAGADTQLEQMKMNFGL
jgi:flagellar assembly protein FliH